MIEIKLLNKKKRKSLDVHAPVKGSILGIEKVNDPVFSKKMIGDGMAVIPADKKICAPIDGIIESVFPTNHAFIINGRNGIQVLVHIGLDTVELGGSPFRRIKEPGSRVKAGDCIIEADYEWITERGFDSAVITIAPEREVCNKTELSKICGVHQVLFSVV